MLATYQSCFRRLGAHATAEKVSAQEVLMPYFRETTVEDWRLDAQVIRQFLSEPYSLSDKEHLIQSWVDLSFNTKRLAPMLWVDGVLVALEAHIAQA